MPRRATLYLEPSLRKSAEEGAHNFIARLTGVLRAQGFSVCHRPEEEAGTDPETFALTHMKPPPPGGLTFRRVYHYPFWAIESTAERWNWTVAKSPYSPETVPVSDSARFYRRWQDRLFPDSAETAARDGFVYVPLQGRLLQRRSFQSCAPIKMLEQVLDRDRQRRVVATLHPGETYSTDESEALTRLAARHDRLELRTGGMEPLLRTCDYVVTMNSSAAFDGYLFGKPCILFGRIDFHHIALKATPRDPAAFDRVADHRPDYARYLWWFWQKMSINAGRPEAEARIRDALVRGGWPLK
ncbi:hypothetical protein OB2597_12633 [Pseudooceanicola batsensis HTCC2597]|uniref:Uncharacterized protein n=1 Tax=Pseudooceanicola batsensis (strain ATCC BAA-863 / DSM 15984 / KCTC 12145 / HTCC2597) TaxID=252305 RepID=A3TXV5_PSEBH|nr:hypothetical protein [Pseudooceanicola batsensis]EAQ02989.1 hypothetical protein OB2597_12633 [Pseudooceanicola batsensis HTCC2597]